MRLFTSIVAAVAATFAVGSANAAAILIDDFSNLPRQEIVDPTNGGVGVTGGTALGNGIATSRSIFADMLTGGLEPNSGGDQRVRVGGVVGATGATANQLNMSTSADVDQLVRVTWTLAPTALTGPVSLFFRVLNSNIGLLPAGVENNTLSFTLNGDLLGTATIGNTINTDIYLTLTASQVASLATSSSLLMVANGAPGWDLSMTSFALQVPEPASLALVGLGLLGAGLASRRRKAV
jgi:PEP-CTERM motif